MEKEFKEIISETDISYKRNNYIVKYNDGQLLIPVGGFRPEEPEIDIYSLSEQQINDLLNKKFQEGRRLCFICGSKDYLGICCRVFPTDITESERKLQSEESRKLNEIRSNLSSVKTPLENDSFSFLSTKKYYNPYPKVQTLTDSVTESKRNNFYRLKIELAPCYICVHCRRMGECGSVKEINGLHPSFPGIPCKIPPPQQRNLLNKFEQRNYQIARFQDKDGTFYPITDRFCIIQSESEAKTMEINIIQQLELMYNPALVNTSRNITNINEKSEHLSTLLRNVIPALLRAAPCCAR